MSEGDLRVWWLPQIPMEPFLVSVPSVDAAKLLLTTLGRYDLFQIENGVKPDYCNAGGLEVFENGEWVEWIDPETGDEIDKVMRLAA